MPLRKAETYFGKVCARHPALQGERSKSDHGCSVCKKERTYRRRAENPERERQLCKSRRERNPEKAREKLREWRAANPGRSRELNLANAKRNNVWAKRRAQKMKAAVHLTAIERARYHEFFEIARARSAQTGEKWVVDHDVPMSRGGLDHPDNLMLLPASMNLAKGARFASTLDFLLS